MFDLANNIFHIIVMRSHIIGQNEGLSRLKIWRQLETVPLQQVLHPQPHIHEPRDTQRPHQLLHGGLLAVLLLPLLQYLVQHFPPSWGWPQVVIILGLQTIISMSTQHMLRGIVPQIPWTMNTSLQRLTSELSFILLTISSQVISGGMRDSCVVEKRFN